MGFRLAPTWRPLEQRPWIRFVREALLEPLGWSAPRHVRVGADLFGPGVSTTWIADIVEVIEKSPSHTFLVSTRDAKRMHEQLSGWERNGCWAPPPNLWLGVALFHDDGQTFQEESLDALVCTRAVKRFVDVTEASEVEIAPFVGCSYCVAGAQPQAWSCRMCNGTGVAIEFTCRGGGWETNKPMTAPWVRAALEKLGVSG